jgi:hypothetical protein
MGDPSTLAVQERAQAALAASPIYVLRELLVERVGSALVLTGTVDTFYHKQLAQELVRAVASSVDVINVVEVCERSPFVEVDVEVETEASTI